MVWDWNGTLYDDLEIVVDSVNASLGLFGAPHITAEGYRDHYARPVKLFYEHVLGKVISDEEWRQIDVHFHGVYRESLGRAGLSAGAHQAMGSLRAAGHTQSILSMWWHDELVLLTERLGVTEYMVAVEGNTADAGERKAMHLARHIAALDGHLEDQSRDVVMIGDSLDDALAAADNRVRCVMLDSGSHHRHELESTGYPVAGSVLEALELVGLP